MSLLPGIADLLRLERCSDLPAIRPGDTVRVHVRVVEGNRERPQMFEGVVLEVKKPNEQRLEEYIDSNLEILRNRLYSTAPRARSAARCASVTPVRPVMSRRS